jgi:hypothetical protein
VSKKTRRKQTLKMIESLCVHWLTSTEEKKATMYICMYVRMYVGIGFRASLLSLGWPLSIMARVTRLGEFSPIVPLFSLGRFFSKLPKLTNFGATFSA